MARKFLLAAGLALLEQGSGTQILMAILTMFAYVPLSALDWPYSPRLAFIYPQDTVTFTQ